MKSPTRQKLVVILGPTSSGKTGLARRLCKEFGGYIVSADSRQVYRYMDIGTGKADTEDELGELQRQRHPLLARGAASPSEYALVFEGVPHYMIDIIPLTEKYNVALYQREVYYLLNSKLKTPTSQIPFLVGGTGQYIDAVVDNWQFSEGEPNEALRQELEERARSEGVAVLWNELLARDPECAEFVQKENPRRVVRALEYVLSTGRKFSTGRRKGERQFEVLKIGIDVPREELYKKIDERVDARLALGMVPEVWNLHTDIGISWERLRQFGLEYRIIGEWLEKLKAKNSKLKAKEMNKTSILGSMEEMSQLEGYQDMAQKLKWAIHDYARRQLTWFRRDKEVRWVCGYHDAQRLVERFLLYQTLDQ